MHPRALLFAAALAFSPAALAQAPDPQRAAAAQVLFDEAQADMDKKNYPAAMKKLEEVTKLLPDALGAKVMLAECYENVGKLASAWSQYTIVQGLAAKAGQAERAEKAGARAVALKPRLATLTIDVPGEVAKLPGLAISRDGIPLGDVQWGTPVPVDAGEHQIVATAPGHRPWQKTVEILSNGSKASVKVEALVREAPVGPPGAEPAKPERPWQMPLGIGVLAGGVAGLALGGIMGGLAMAKLDESNADGHCVGNQCDRAGFDARNLSLTFGDVSTAAFVIGGVLTAGGVVLVATAPGKKSAEKKAALRVLPGGLSFEGSF